MYVPLRDTSFSTLYAVYRRIGSRLCSDLSAVGCPSYEIVWLKERSGSVRTSYSGRKVFRQKTDGPLFTVL